MWKRPSTRKGIRAQALRSAQASHLPFCKTACSEQALSISSWLESHWLLQRQTKWNSFCGVSKRMVSATHNRWSSYVLRTVDPKDRSHPVKLQPETHVCSTPPVSPRPSLQGCWGQVEWECTVCRDTEPALLLRGCFSLESSACVGTNAGGFLILMDYFFKGSLGSKQILELWPFLMLQNNLDVCVRIAVTNCWSWDAEYCLP